MAPSTAACISSTGVLHLPSTKGATSKVSPGCCKICSVIEREDLPNISAKKVTRKQKHAFETLYSTLNTAYTTDVDTHIKKQKKAWKQNEVKISGTKASLITVVFHSSFGENENELFIGHAGVLVPTKDKKLLFVEKLSFSLPYQVLKFDNRKQLKNYLMGMYDTSWGQEEAKPFIMENTKTAL